MTQDAAAMGELGERLLRGDEGRPDLARGVALIDQAAALGDPRALHRQAVLIAAGLGREPDWPAALDTLRRAADLGWPDARAQLDLLAIDESPPTKRVLSRRPPMDAVEAVASQAVCDWIIARGRERLRPARVYDAATGAGTQESDRNNREAEFDIGHTDLVILRLQARIAAAVGHPFTRMENANLLHYRVGQRFARHVDFLDPALPGFAQDIARNGQRVATVLLYLNDDYEGGETEFPIVGLRHKGGRGEALLFANVDEAGAPDRRTLHAGLAPTRGEKWLFSQFIRGPMGPGA